MLLFRYTGIGYKGIGLVKVIGLFPYTFILYTLYLFFFLYKTNVHFYSVLCIDQVSFFHVG